MAGKRKEIPKEETYKFRGGAAMDVEIIALEDRGAFIRVSSKDVPSDGVCIDGMFVYTSKHTPLQSGHSKTDAYVDDQRGLDARFRAKGRSPRRCGRWVGGGDSPAPTAKLRILRADVSFTAYRKWDFTVMGVSRDFLKSDP